MIHYKGDKQSELFWLTLQDRIRLYFNQRHLSMYANSAMWFKVFLVLLLFIVPVLLIFYTGISLPGKWLLCVVAGLGMAAIGLCISHQAVHGALSKNQYINRIFGLTFNMLGMSDYIWKIKHNISHHAHTNIYEFDEALKEGDMIRMSRDVPRKKMHQYQHLYTGIIYSFFTLFWAFALDFEKLLRYNGEGRSNKSPHKSKELFIFWITKAYYVFICFIYPYYFLHFEFLQIIIGFLTMHIVASSIITHVLQVEHLFEGVHLPELGNDETVHVSWAVTQLEGTSNFKTNNPFLDWFVGGSNYQIEHHLFPKICAIHYPGIGPIVKQTAEEFGYVYYRHHSFYNAIRSHYSFLKRLGHGK